jgi:hypothetical protein
MFARLNSPFAFAALVAASAAFAAWPSASQNRVPAAGTSAGAPLAGAAGTAAPMHGPTALGFLEFDWNGALPGFSPWRGDATTADIFPQQVNAAE